MDREIEGSRLLDHCAALMVAKLGCGYIFRIILEHAAVQFAYGILTSRIAFKRDNDWASWGSAISKFDNALRIALQTASGPALRQFRPWLKISSDHYYPKTYRLEFMLGICHS